MEVCFQANHANAGDNPSWNLAMNLFSNQSRRELLCLRDFLAHLGPSGLAAVIAVLALALNAKVGTAIAVQGAEDVDAMLRQPPSPSLLRERIPPYPFEQGMA